MSIVNKKRKASISDIFVETGLGFSEVNGVLNTLVRNNLVRVIGKTVTSTTNNLNLSQLNFTERPRYAHLGNSEVLQARISESVISNYIQSLGAKVTNARKAYMPFYRVESPKGNKIVDGMSCSLAIKA